MPRLNPRSMIALLAAMTLTVLVPVVSAQPEDERIPQFASAQFGWMTTHDDWLQPPPGSGHGPIGPDPAYPYVGSVEGGRLGKQPTNRLGDYKDPILKPWAQQEMQRSNEEVLAGQRREPFAAQASCWPGGVPGQLLYPFEPLYFIQTPKEVWMIWQRDHMVRHVLLDRQHSQNVKPSWFGESVGHYENGDTLVVDTIGLSTHNSFLDNFRTPHTEQEHVIERFTMAPDGKGMTAIARVEDPGAFNGPLVMQEVWTKANGPLQETICGENVSDFFGGNPYPIPESTTRDF
jgi:hypothetical protein